MTAKVLKNTGEFIPWSTLCTLTIEETDNPNLKEQCRRFDEAVIAKLVYTATETELPDKYLTPTYYAYVDDITEGAHDSPDKDLEPMPEAGEN